MFEVYLKCFKLTKGLTASSEMRELNRRLSQCKEVNFERQLFDMFRLSVKINTFKFVSNDTAWSVIKVLLTKLAEYIFSRKINLTIPC